MSRNYVQPGNYVTVPAPYAVSSGDGVLLGSLFGVATTDALIGVDVECAIVGVWSLPKDSSVLAVGSPVYWDEQNHVASGVYVSTNSPLIGVCTAAAGGSATTVAVRLNGISVYVI